jgi:TRAP-type mannitol/chloroaromatic compound transport system permease small subunit
MTLLLRLSKLIDGLSERIGLAVRWLILIAVVISAGNATVRYLFSTSSNAWLELQWYLFAAVFLLCAPYALLRNEHVRIDVITDKFSHRTRAWIDVFGTVFFLLPMAALIVWLSWPMFLDSFQRGEMSTDAGGLIRWPVKILIPIGFTLLLLQGLSELIKRLAFLQGRIEDPFAHPQELVSDLMTLDDLRQDGGHRDGPAAPDGDRRP